MRLLNIDQTLQGLLAANSQQQQQATASAATTATAAAAAGVRQKLENRCGSASCVARLLRLAWKFQSAASIVVHASLASSVSAWKVAQFWLYTACQKVNAVLVGACYGVARRSGGCSAHMYAG
jgi:hypothetical protein